MDNKILRTYNKTWKFEKKIYAIDNIRLPFPINPDAAIYLLIGFMTTLLLLKIMPFLNGIPFIIRYIALPYLLMKFLMKKKFDGKLAHRFLFGYVDYIGLPKEIARFQAGVKHSKGLFTPVAFRNREIVNVTETALGKTKKKRRNRTYV